MAAVPIGIAGVRRARLLHSATTTRRAYVTDATHIEYERKALVFFRFCDDIGAARLFHPDTIIIFFEMCSPPLAIGMERILKVRDMKKDIQTQKAMEIIKVKEWEVIVI